MHLAKIGGCLQAPFHPPEALKLAFKATFDFWDKEKQMSSLELAFQRLLNDYRALLMAADRRELFAAFFYRWPL